MSRAVGHHINYILIEGHSEQYTDYPPPQFFSYIQRPPVEKKEDELWMRKRATMTNFEPPPNSR